MKIDSELPSVTSLPTELHVAAYQSDDQPPGPDDDGVPPEAAKAESAPGAGLPESS